MHLTKATSRTVLSFFAIATAFTLATATPATASGFDTSANPTAETDEGVIFSVTSETVSARLFQTKSSLSSGSR